MTIGQIVDEAFRTQLLSREMQVRLARLLSADSELCEADYRALGRLRAALLGGKLSATARRQFRNVMEELVWEELEAVAGGAPEIAPHFHEVVAYALNRLPPLYATTEVGAEYQRHRAREDLHGMVAEHVNKAVEMAREQPRWHPERTPVGGSLEGSLLEQMGTLLQQYASVYEG